METRRHGDDGGWSSEKRWVSRGRVSVAMRTSAVRKEISKWPTEDGVGQSIQAGLLYGVLGL